MKKRTGLWLCLLVVFMASCGKEKIQTTLPETVVQSEEAGSESFRRFAATSGSQILQEKGNQLYGTVGPYQLLALLSEGADGESKAEIYRTLSIDATDYPSLTAFNQGLIRDYQDGETASIANSVWVNQSSELTKNFEEAAKDQFSAEIEQVPFEDQPKKAGKRIANWVKKQLEADLFEQKTVTSATRLVLVNTVRLNLAWLEKFDPEATRRLPFYGETEEVRADFMSQSHDSYHYARGDNYLASSLDLENDHQLLVILPDKGVAVNELIETPEKLQALIDLEESQEGDVRFKIPKFEFTSDIDLVEVMKKLGMKDVFDENKADLSRILADEEPLFVSNFQQRSQLKLDEEKVKVESVTSMDMATSSAMPVELEFVDLTLDRPFIFMIQGKDKLPLFMGVIRNPLTK